MIIGERAAIIATKNAEIAFSEIRNVLIDFDSTLTLNRKQFDSMIHKLSDGLEQLRGVAKTWDNVNTQLGIKP